MERTICGVAGNILVWSLALVAVDAELRQLHYQYLA